MWLEWREYIVVVIVVFFFVLRVVMRIVEDLDMVGRLVFCLVLDVLCDGFYILEVEVR